MPREGSSTLCRCREPKGIYKKPARIALGRTAFTMAVTAAMGDLAQDKGCQDRTGLYTTMAISLKGRLG